MGGRPAAAEHYRDGGNPFRDLGVHGLYLLRAVLGEIEGVEPVFVARGGDPNLCFDEWDVVVLCERGVGHVRLSWSVRPLQTVFTVHATRRHAACRRGLDVRDRRGAPAACPMRSTAPPGRSGRAGPPCARSRRTGCAGCRGGCGRMPELRRAVEQFYVALADGTPLPASLEDGRRVVRWVEAAALLADAAKRLRERARPSSRPAPTRW